MRISTAAFFAVLVTSATVQAQTPAPPVAPPTGQKTLAATVGVYAFPGAGQTTAQQSKDETECYNWSVQNTGSDPFQVAKQAEQQQQQAAAQQQQVQQSTQGAGAKGAVKGAAAGALIGEIANDDAGEGAAVGAAAGVVAGRSRARGAQQQAAQQSAQQSQAAAQASAQQIDAFKKGFSACLEAKKYTVKF